MTRTALALSMVTVLVGCTGATTLPSAAVEARPATHESSPPAKAAFTPEAAPAKVVTRAVGDFVVFKFSGTYRKSPLVLTERVVALQGEDVVIEFAFTEGTKSSTFRALTGAAGKSDLYGFTKLNAKGVTVDASRDEFESFMAKTVLSADDNEETLATTTADVEIGGKTWTATTTAFRVRIGKTNATMKISQSDAFAWGDLAAEIVATDGTVLYRAELLEVGHVSE